MFPVLFRPFLKQNVPELIRKKLSVCSFWWEERFFGSVSAILKQEQERKGSTGDHNGCSSSQIDYFLTNHLASFAGPLINTPGCNLSAHRAITCSFHCSFDTQSSKPTKQPPIRKLLWHKADPDEYSEVLDSLVRPEMFDIQNTSDIDALAETIPTMLHIAARQTVPTKQVRLQGPKRRISREALQLAKQVKVARADASQFPADHPAHGEAKKLSKQLRSRLRQEKAVSNKAWFNKIMAAQRGDTGVFYKLIRRQRAVGNSYTPLQANEKLIHDPNDQCIAWAKYIAELFSPLKSPRFNAEHTGMVAEDISCIAELCNSHRSESIPISKGEIAKAIDSMKTGKAPDANGLAAEHLKFADSGCLDLLAALFQSFQQHLHIPSSVKESILGMLGKKGKNLMQMTNYRGISITVLLGKLLDTVQENRRLDRGSNQSPLQFGFTSGLSPTMASLILSEAIVDARENHKDLYVATLDTQKAFDVVHHETLLRQLYLDGMDPNDWLLMAQAYSGMTTQVRWRGQVSEAIPIQQGVRQGGVQSPSLYKQFIDPLLRQLQKSGSGLSLGGIYLGAPTVADDVLLLANSPLDLQHMLDIVSEYSSLHRYNIHPTKSEVCIFTREPDFLPSLKSWDISDSVLPVSNTTTHLGITRGDLQTNDLIVDTRITQARRTCYALMSIGLHGHNGLNAAACIHIYRTYVLPRLLYGLEAISLTGGQISELDAFHTRTLRLIQSLPQRSAKCAVFMLSGVLPFEALYHYSILSMVGRIVRSENRILACLAVRQLSTCAFTSNSWFVKAAKILIRYDLPDLVTLLENTPSEYAWKTSIRNAVYSSWEDQLKVSAAEKSTLASMNTATFTVGTMHPVWATTEPCVQDVKRATVKVRILTSTYLLQSTRAKFRQHNVTSTCPLCGLEDEDKTHFLLVCDRLAEPREKFLPILLAEAGPSFKSIDVLSNSALLTQLIVDCTVLLKDYSREQLESIECISRRLVYALHTRRMELLTVLCLSKKKPLRQ